MVDGILILIELSRRSKKFLISFVLIVLFLFLNIDISMKSGELKTLKITFKLAALKKNKKDEAGNTEVEEDFTSEYSSHKKSSLKDIKQACLRLKKKILKSKLQVIKYLDVKKADDDIVIMLAGAGFYCRKNNLLFDSKRHLRLLHKRWGFVTNLGNFSSTSLQKLLNMSIKRLTPSHGVVAFIHAKKLITLS